MWGHLSRGIVDCLDYIQKMGFDAIWISPIVSTFEGSSAYGEAYHGLFGLPSPWKSSLTVGIALGSDTGHRISILSTLISELVRA